MKKGIHPKAYRKSCANTKETTTWEDGNEYPLVKLEISNESHPFFTGKMTLVDTAGRIEKFRSKYAKFSKKPAAATTEEAPAPAEETKEEAPEA
ncbi:UNVERIFIED_CONTAM: hypothetical protein GTU68_014417 [Idotea baltica]|nr:hypothetical protein [Idotea baltica]